MASITQYRGKTWRAVVRRVGWPVQSKTFSRKKDAEAWAAMIEAKQGISQYDPLQLRQATALTAQDVFARYLTEVGYKQKGRNATGILKRLMRDATFMRLRFDRITANDIRDWRDDRAQEVAHASVHRELNTISAVFTHAIKEWGLPIAANPCHAVSRYKGADKPRNKIWTDADIAAFLQAAHWRDGMQPKTGRDYCGPALLLALETAMRIGEMCLPTVADFYPAQKYLHLSDTKNGDQRNVPLSSRAMAIVTLLCKDKKPADKIIPLQANTLGEYMLDVRRACGLGHLHTHDARHTAATTLSRKLSNVLELAAVTGHRSLKSLHRYYHPEPSELADKLG